MVLANKDLKLYKESPELYLNYKNLNVGRILGIVGIVLSALTLLAYVYLYSLGPEKLLEFQKNLEAKAKYQQEQDKKMYSELVDLLERLATIYIDDCDLDIKYDKKRLEFIEQLKKK